jgi:hypothetical protein
MPRCRLRERIPVREFTDLLVPKPIKRDASYDTVSHLRGVVGIGVVTRGSNFDAK